MIKNFKKKLRILELIRLFFVFVGFLYSTGGWFAYTFYGMSELIYVFNLAYGFIYLCFFVGMTVVINACKIEHLEEDEEMIMHLQEYYADE